MSSAVEGGKGDTRKRNPFGENANQLSPKEQKGKPQKNQRTLLQGKLPLLSLKGKLN